MRLPPGVRSDVWFPALTQRPVFRLPFTAEFRHRFGHDQQSANRKSQLQSLTEAVLAALADPDPGEHHRLGDCPVDDRPYNEFSAARGEPSFVMTPLCFGGATFRSQANWPARRCP
jgi:hypothetical protein